MNASDWPITIVESPYAGDVAANEAYAEQASMDCLRRQEVPYASHLFFTRFLDDMEPSEREQGLTAGYAFWRGATKIAFYMDRGMSSGMNRALARAQALGQHDIEYRYLHKEEQPCSQSPTTTEPTTSAPS